MQEFTHLFLQTIFAAKRFCCISTMLCQSGCIDQNTDMCLEATRERTTHSTMKTCKKKKPVTCVAGINIILAQVARTCSPNGLCVGVRLVPRVQVLRFTVIAGTFHLSGGQQRWRQRVDGHRSCFILCNFVPFGMFCQKTLAKIRN